MKYKAIFWVGGSVHTIIECEKPKQFANDIRRQVIQMIDENEYNYSIEITRYDPKLYDPDGWKKFL